MRTDLSIEAKQSFQVVALLATILVVGIHYKSDIPDFPSPREATWNQLAQEFVFGGIARVAVPLFALTAGLLYFRSDDGSLASYRTKLRQRVRTVAVPYLIIGSVAFACWLLVARLTGGELELGWNDLITTWILHPPAQQLWFLRDLMVLVLIAPLIRMVCVRRVICPIFAAALIVAWAANVQVFPIVGGWHLIHIETMLFFTIGCLASLHPRWIEGLGRVSGMTVVFTSALWLALIGARITVKANFDIWYASAYGPADLMLHQASILVGSAALLMIAFRLRHPRLIQLSGASFFVYLVHEYPLRAVVRHLGDRVMDHDISSWVELPIVLIGCFATAVILSRAAPTAVGILTGGRTPSKAIRIGQLAVDSTNPAHAQ